MSSIRVPLFATFVFYPIYSPFWPYFPLQSSIFLMVFCAASSGLPGTGLRLIPSLLAASSIHRESSSTPHLWDRHKRKRQARLDCSCANFRPIPLLADWPSLPGLDGWKWEYHQLTNGEPVGHPHSPNSHLRQFFILACPVSNQLL
jgi:hypothetical protein